MSSNIHFTSALEDFRLARRQAAIQSVLGWMRGRREDLLSYEDVRKQLRAIESAYQKLQEIPLSSIVGSVNRYTDFTRNFMPKRSINGERWARVKAASQDMVGLPPIDVYQIGEVYFVQDGNHRVSIARQDGASSIQAYVKEVHTKISLTPDFQPDDLIIKAEYLDFLENTHIDELRPQSVLNTSSPGRYPSILQQIEAVKFAIEYKRGLEISFQEAVLYWHDKIYLPIVQIIRDQELLQDFPSRTETDLYIWMVKYQSELAQELGWNVTPETAASMLRSRLSPWRIRFWKKFKDAILPDKIKPEPPVGQWRQKQLDAHQGRLFADIMVVITGQKEDWNILDYGLNIAKEEGSQVYGLHVAYPKHNPNKYTIQTIRSRFNQHCENFDVFGTLVFETTRRPSRLILKRANWADLVLLPLNYARGDRRGEKLDILVHRCPTPIFAIHKNAVTPIKKALLAYDGSPKSEEALFLATYLARFWELELVVLTVFGTKKVPNHTIAKAFGYLNRYNVDAEYIKASGHPATAVTILATEDQCDLIIVGGYRSKPIKKWGWGSVIDEILLKSQQSVLICK